MDSDNKFWLGVCALIAFGVSVLILSITLGNQLTNAKIVEMVKAGANPIAAHCAIAINSSQDAVCFMTIAQQK